MYARPRKVLVALGVVFGALVIAGALTLILGAGPAGQGRPGRSRLLTSPPSPASRSTALGGFRAVSPATTVPTQSPVQQQYDRGFVHGYSSASSKAMIAEADALRIPSPTVGGGWPALAVSNTPEGWARSFVRALLSIDFARQSRTALGAWLVAEHAPDLMPGIPAAFGARSLYVSVLQPQIMGQAPVIPSPAQWRANARAGVRWTISDLQVSLDPQWQAMIDAGWQPRDLRASLQDVSGLLTVTRGTKTTRRDVSLSVAVGSASWHPGYGTVAVTAQGS